MRSNPSSSTTLTPNDFALSSFEPAPGPATTRSVFALTDPVALPPIERTRASASSRDRRSRFPVKTIVLPTKGPPVTARGDRKSTRLNSSHVRSSYAVFCLKKKNRNIDLKYRTNHDLEQNRK